MSVAPNPTVGDPATFVYREAPLLVYWEITRACDLACTHCRAEALSQQDPNELTTAEGKALLANIWEFGRRPPHVVITGGDPLQRPDLFALISHAGSFGIPVALAPAVTPRLTAAVLQQLRDHGIDTISLSLDGATAARHDGIRGVPGTFDRTLAAARRARDAGIRLQVNTLVTAETLGDLPALYQLLHTLDIVRWSLFFLIPVGRGVLLRPITAEQAETVCHWLLNRMGEAPFAVRATEAPYFRRVAVQRMLAQGLQMSHVLRHPVGRSFGIRDGNGVVFVSHTGEVYPSGFLPLPSGNVRQTPLTQLYRESPLFTALRDTSQYGDPCGRCRYRTICGGSRARAFAVMGDALAGDPLCAYQPGGGNGR